MLLRDFGSDTFPSVPARLSVLEYVPSTAFPTGAGMCTEWLAGSLLVEHRPLTRQPADLVTIIIVTKKRSVNVKREAGMVQSWLWIYCLAAMLEKGR
jgi:hypothetical protein